MSKKPIKEATPQELKIQAKVSEIFPRISAYVRFTSQYGSDLPKNEFHIEFQYHDTSFDDLMKISEAFNTRKINLGSERRSSGYCETCYHSYSVNVVRVEELPSEWGRE